MTVTLTEAHTRVTITEKLKLSTNNGTSATGVTTREDEADRGPYQADEKKVIETSSENTTISAKRLTSLPW